MRPRHYDRERVGTFFPVRVAEVEREAGAAGLPPAGHATALLLIDFQVDFCHPTGSLYVPGAIDDLRRTIEFLYERAGEIDRIYASLDTHHLFQIFHPVWWEDEAGRPPPPFAPITSEDLSRGRWRPVRDEAWSRDYVRKLEEGGRQTLIIWPYHVLLGSPGHALDPSLFEAVLHHSIARRSGVTWIRKGDIARTEHYSIFEPEVEVREEPGGSLNHTVLQQLAGFDRVYIAGEAKSHCVLASVRSIVEYFRTPDALGKFHVLTDCTSSVIHPSIDFDAAANEMLHRYEREGIRLTTTHET